MIPIHKNYQEFSNNKDKPFANFGLWYNKFVPVNDKNEACDNKDKDKKTDYYAEKFDTKNCCAKKIEQQKTYVQIMSVKYKVIEIIAYLETPMVLGIGESHPSEASMIFDYNLGVPHIPASSIKGVFRTAWTVEQIKKNPSDLEIIKKNVYDLFGSDDSKNPYQGDVVFLDAYPQNAIQLRADISNVHYSKYYSDEKTFPDETENPTPIKFLTVATGVCFGFTVLVKNTRNSICVELEKCIKNALTTNGFGAKSSLGYGRFNLEKPTMKQNQSGQTVVESKKTIKKDDTVCVELLTRNGGKNKNKWNVKCVADNKICGLITNSDKVPLDKKQGDSIKVKVSNLQKNKSNSEFVVIT